MVSKLRHLTRKTVRSLKLQRTNGEFQTPDQGSLNEEDSSTALIYIQENAFI